jgi:4-amino-4-deoxy-L-arabinose transferase-like glycosyltransferase
VTAGAALADAKPIATRSPWTLAVAVVAGSASLHLILAALLPVFQDEAYYWEWSRHLAAGYYDHPPGIALLIRAGAELLALVGMPATPLALRLGAIAAGAVAMFATIAMARRIAGDDAALRAGVVLSFMPLAAGLVLATPDAPLLATTAAALYAVVRVLEVAPSSRASLFWWSIAGLALGLAFWSKYTSVLLPAGVLVAMTLRGDLRRRLREPGPYAACIIATIVFLPVVVWNYRHGWLSFGFQLQHGFAASSGPFTLAALGREGEYVGGQAALASPILFPLFAIAIWRGIRQRESSTAFVLAVVAALTFGFYAFSALRHRVEPNWPAPAYVPAIVLLATQSWAVRGRRWTRAGVAFAGVMSTLIYLHGVVPILPFPAAKDPIARGFGWEMVADRAAAARRTLTSETGARSWLGADRYQDAAELAFHDSLHTSTFAVNLAGRHNQYDLWPGFAQRAARGDNLVLLVDDGEGIHEAVAKLRPYFESSRRGESVALKRGAREIGKRRIWLLIGWKEGWPQPSGSSPAVTLQSPRVALP